MAERRQDEWMCSAVQCSQHRRYCMYVLVTRRHFQKATMGNTKEYTTGLMQHAIWIGREARENGVRQ